MKGPKSNLGVKTASVKNNLSKFECLLEFTFTYKGKYMVAEVFIIFI